MVKKWLMIAALAAVVFAPSTARADWLFTPSIGAGFGGAASGREHMTWGASIGWMGAGAVGWEADLAYTPEFFESDDDDLDFIENSNVTSFMANVVLGIPMPAGAQTGIGVRPGVRPYVSGGGGFMQFNVQGDDDLFEVDTSELGVNVGGGVMGFMTDNVGFRGDIRYYRALSDPEPDDDFEFNNIDLADFDFWRATGGITFRW